MDVAFEVERFARADDGGLEVAGRWRGLDGRRVRRPRLTVVAGGRRVGLAAAEADELITDGEPWRARFYFEGDTDPAAVAELDVGRNLVVELPPPDVSPVRLAPEPEPEPSEPAAAVQLDAARLQRAERTLEQARAELAAAESARMQAQAEAERLREVAELRTAQAQTTRAENEEQRAQLQRLVEQAGRYEQALAQERERGQQALAQERERGEQAAAPERERASALETERARLAADVARLEAELERARAQAEAAREDLAAARRRPDSQAATRVDPPPARPLPPREPVTRPLPAAAAAEGRRPLWTGAAEPRRPADPTQRLDPETWWASHQPPHPRSAWSVWLARVLALGLLLAVVVVFALVTGAL